MSKIKFLVLAPFLVAMYGCSSGGGDAGTTSGSIDPASALTQNISFAGGTLKDGQPPAPSFTPGGPVIIEPTITSIPTLTPGMSGSIAVQIDQMPLDTTSFNVNIQFDKSTNQYITIPINDPNLISNLASSGGTGTLNLPFSLNTSVCNDLDNIQHQIKCYETVELADGTTVSTEAAQQMVLACNNDSTSVNSIVGTWVHTHPASCLETFVFNVDNTWSSASADERLTGTYQYIGDNAGTNSLALNITSDNALQDCSGDIEDDAGLSLTLGVNFLSSTNMLWSGIISRDLVKQVASNGASNSIPKASIASSANVTTGTIVTLDGSSSSDVDGDSLSYQWSFISIPAGSATVLVNDSLVTSAFTPDINGTYILQLIVNDGQINSSAVTATVISETQTSILNTVDLKFTKLLTAYNLIDGGSTVDGFASFDATRVSCGYSFVAINVTVPSPIFNFGDTIEGVINILRGEAIGLGGGLTPTIQPDCPSSINKTFNTTATGFRSDKDFNHIFFNLNLGTIYDLETVCRIELPIDNSSTIICDGNGGLVVSNVGRPVDIREMVQ